MRNLLFCTYFIFVFSFLLFINLYYLEGIPHVPDSVAYLFMAKMFAGGHIIQAIPISPASFDFFPGILSIEKGTWLFQYPFGHPLLLSFGVLIGFPNVIPPLIGTINILLLYKIAKKIFNDQTALFLLPLPLASPFFLENSSSFMSHNSALFYLLFSFYFLVLGLKSKNLALPFLSGIFLGLLLNTRPLTCLPFFLIFGTLIVIKYPIKKLSSISMFYLGFFLLLLCFIFYNYLTTGSFFQFQYYTVNQGLFDVNEKTIVSFIHIRFQNTSILFNNFFSMLFAWPALFTYILLILPLVTKKRTFWDITSFCILFTLPIVYFFYNGTFIMYGPRFWYEIIPFAFILTARSFFILFTFRKKVTVIFFTILFLFSLTAIFGITPSKDPDIFSPISLTKLKGFNFTDKRIPNIVKSSRIENAIVFVKDCNGNWWCFGSVFSKNSPNLDTSIVYAKDLGEKNILLLNYFHTKSAYTIDYDTYELKRIR